jgi:hypothetical protein
MQMEWRNKMSFFRVGNTAVFTAILVAIGFITGLEGVDAMNVQHSAGKSKGQGASTLRTQKFTNNKSSVNSQIGSVRSHSGFNKKTTISSGSGAMASSNLNSSTSLSNFKVGAYKNPHLLPDLNRVPDPSDTLRGLNDYQHAPGRDMINSKYLGGPDREYNQTRDGSYLDYKQRNTNSDISNADCMWNEGTWNKVSHWGGNSGGPLVGDTTTGNNFRCGPDSSQGTDNGGDNKGSGGKDTSGKTSNTKDTVKEDKVVKDDSGKPGDKGSKGTEGDDPDELKSFSKQKFSNKLQSLTPFFNRDALNLADHSNPGNGSGNGTQLTRSGTKTPRGLPSTQHHRIGPNHENRPDTLPSTASSALAVNSLSFASSPTPDGGSNPPPGPEYSPVGIASQSALSSAVTSRTGSVSSPAIGDNGGSVTPNPGPEF